MIGIEQIKQEKRKKAIKNERDTSQKNWILDQNLGYFSNCFENFLNQKLFCEQNEVTEWNKSN